MNNEQRKKHPQKVGIEPLLITVNEAAHLMRLSSSKVYTMLAHRRPDGIPIKRFDRAIRISLDDLREWVKRH